MLHMEVQDSYNNPNYFKIQYFNVSVLMLASCSAVAHELGPRRGIPALLTLCAENPLCSGRFDVQKMHNVVLWYFICCTPQQSSEQIVYMLVKLDIVLILKKLMKYSPVTVYWPLDRHQAIPNSNNNSNDKVCHTHAIMSIGSFWARYRMFAEL